MHRLRSSALFVALSSLCGACFVETPGLDEQDTTTGSPCQLGHMSCACYGNGTCEAGLVCNPDVQLCIPESCNPGEMDCVCNGGACLPGLVCDGELCVDAGSSSTPSTTADESSATMPDSSGDDSHASEDASTGTTSDSTTGEDTLPLDESSSDGSDPTGEEMCADLLCESCIDCVDDFECKDEFDACAAAENCATAVACMVECAVIGVCLDDCCMGLDDDTKELVSALAVCKSDRCSDPCTGQAEFPACV